MSRTDPATPPPLSPLGLAALTYAADYGWPVLPLHWSVNGRCSCGNNDADHKPAKHPYADFAPSGLKNATTHPEQVATWWDAHPQMNIGIATGPGSGLLVVDVDGAEGVASLARYAELPRTVAASTGRGMHYYFQHPDGLTLGNSAGRLGPKLDTRGAGGYVIAPGSIHYTGSSYRWQDGCSPDEVELAPVPADILAALQPPTRLAVAPTTPARHITLSAASRGPLTQFRAWLAKLPTGLSDGDGRKLAALRIASRGLECLPMGDVLEIVAAWNQGNRPPLSDREVLRKVNEAARTSRPAA